METETSTKTREPVQLAETMQPGVFRLERDGARAYLTRQDVEAVVQQAYDLLGIVATPSYDTEAARGVTPDEWVDQFHAELDRARMERQVSV